MQDNKYWFFGSKLNTVLLLILILLVVGAIYIMFQNKETYLGAFEEQIGQSPKEPLPSSDPRYREISGNREDLDYFSISPGAEVHGLLKYAGSIKGGYFFEGNILVNVLNTNKNIIFQSNATATTDWMTAEPVSFEGSIDFSTLKKGEGYIEIHNDNASGLPENDKFILIPIIIQ